MSMPRLPNQRADQLWDGAVERFMPELLTEGLPDRLERNRPVLVACAGGRRAAIPQPRCCWPGGIAADLMVPAWRSWSG